MFYDSYARTGLFKCDPIQSWHLLISDCDVYIYRFVSSHTVEEAMLLKAHQKRSLVIQKGEFDWRSLFDDETVLNKALGEVQDTEDAHAVAVATRKVVVIEGAGEADFGGDGGDIESGDVVST